jgi:peroxiredoxin
MSSSSIRFLFVAAVLAFAGSAAAKVQPGDRAADFESKTPAGQTVKLSSYRGKVVLVDFWASWCEPCKKELPLLAKMAPRLKARGIEIVAVNIDDRPENATSFMRAHGLELTVVLDSAKQLVAAYEPPQMPSSVLVDRAGVVRGVNAGFDDGDEAKIERQLLALAGR